MRQTTKAVVCAMLIVLAHAVDSSAQVWVAAEIWPGDEDPGSGNVPLYGRGEAEVEVIGVVTAKAFLKRPSGNVMDWSVGPASVYSSANVDSSVHPSSMEIGQYQTLVEGWMGDDLYGCQSSLLAASPYIARYINFGGGEYRSYNCSHACQSSETYWPASHNFLSITGIRFTTFVSWCTPGVRQGHTQPPACFLYEF